MSVRFMAQARVLDRDLLADYFAKYAADIEANYAGQVSYEYAIEPGGDRVIVWEEFTDSRAAVDHIHEMVASGGSDLFLKAVALEALSCLGDVSPELESSMEAFGAVLYGPIHGFRRLAPKDVP